MWIRAETACNAAYGYSWADGQTIEVDDGYAAALLGDNPGGNFTVGEAPTQGSLLAEGGMVSEAEAPHVGEAAPVKKAAKRAPAHQTSPAEQSLADEAAGS